MKRGHLIVISGPSGVGKGTIVREVRKNRANLRFSVSATTREKRPSEVDGREYYFLSKTQFENLIARNALLEHATYVDNYYGTPAEPVDQALAEGYDVLLEIEVVGGLQVKKNRPDAVLIFVAAPSMEELKHRLVGRGDTDPARVEKRLARAKEEYEYIPEYDYVVVNDTVEQATEDVLTILKANEHRARFMAELLKEEP